jgi:hypothetical protein
MTYLVINNSCHNQTTKCSEAAYGFLENKKFEFPKLFKVAKQLKAIPTSSSVIERLFSQTSECLTKRRNRLQPETLLRLSQVAAWPEFKIACDTLLKTIPQAKKLKN